VVIDSESSERIGRYKKVNCNRVSCGSRTEEKQIPS
jgi:hypothetical protein